MYWNGNGRPPPPEVLSSVRLRAATLEARGVISGITNCGRAGLLSAEAVRELNDFYLFRVELLLESASVLERTAQTVRSLVRAMERTAGVKPAVRSIGGVYVS